jgi:hypothetical protein
MTEGATETKKFLEQAYGKQLSDVELMEYKNKIIQLFSLLIEIDKQQKNKVDKTL